MNSSAVSSGIWQRATQLKKYEVEYKPEERGAAVIISVWQKIESLMVDLIAMKQIDIDGPTDKRYGNNVYAAIEALMRQNVITEETADVLHSLYKLRNWVAHNDFEPEEKATCAFFVGAERAINMLEEAWLRSIK